MNNKISILLLIVTLLLPMISATAYTFPYSQDADFAVSCDVDGAPCTSAVNCTLTLRNPDNNYLLDGVDMVIQSNGDAFYQISGSNLTEIGPYTGKVYNLKVADSDSYLVGKDAIIARDY